MLTTKKLHRLLKKAVKKRYNVDTNYQIHKVMNVSKTTVKNWEEGKAMDAESARKIAVFLNLDEHYVMACVAAERSKDEETKQSWLDLAASLAAGFASFAVIISYTTTSAAIFI